MAGSAKVVVFPIGIKYTMDLREKPRAWVLMGRVWSDSETMTKTAGGNVRVNWSASVGSVGYRRCRIS